MASDFKSGSSTNYVTLSVTYVHVTSYPSGQPSPKTLPPKKPEPVQTALAKIEGGHPYRGSGIVVATKPLLVRPASFWGKLLRVVVSWFLP